MDIDGAGALAVPKTKMALASEQDLEGMSLIYLTNDCLIGGQRRSRPSVVSVRVMYMHCPHLHSSYVPIHKLWSDLQDT